MSLTDDYIFVPAEATVTEALCAYLDRDANWWWYLITRKEDAFTICSFGSLLPYLTGKTPHIVHMPDDCPICSGLDTIFWTDTAQQVEAALADPEVRTRRVGDLPMAPLYTITIEEYDEHQAPVSLWSQGLPSNPYGIVDGERLVHVNYEQMRVKGAGFGSTSMPAF